LLIEKECRSHSRKYNRAHQALDETVFAAYGWPSDLADGEILARLLALNMERAAGGSAVVDDSQGEEEG
jgi:hypothetical protein